MDGLGVVLESEVCSQDANSPMDALSPPFGAATASVEATSYFLVWSSLGRSRQLAAFEAWLRAEVAT